MTPSMRNFALTTMINREFIMVIHWQNAEDELKPTIEVRKSFREGTTVLLERCASSPLNSKYFDDGLQCTV
jgi:hypothetical protein